MFILYRAGWEKRGTVGTGLCRVRVVRRGLAELDDDDRISSAKYLDIFKLGRRIGVIFLGMVTRRNEVAPARRNVVDRRHQLGKE